jgi:hypothetical protein
MKNPLIDAIRAAENPAEMQRVISTITLNQIQPLIARELLIRLVQFWIRGAVFSWRSIPPWLRMQLQSMQVTPEILVAVASRAGTPIRRTAIPSLPRPESTTLGQLLLPPEIEGVGSARLWQAAKSVLDRGAVTRPQFDLMSERARSQAFTVAYQESTKIIEQYRQALHDTIRLGASLDEFKQQVEGFSTLTPSHLENVYRTNVQAAFRDGREAVLNNPVVADVFVYQQYIATRDGRVRHDHLMLERLGLDGTSIYRRDDPVWDYFTPPWDYNCRCGVRLLTLKAAAKAGVREAQVWLETGREPVEPEHRFELIPFSPNPGFGQRSGLLAA